MRYRGLKLGKKQIIEVAVKVIGNRFEFYLFSGEEAVGKILQKQHRSKAVER